MKQNKQSILFYVLAFALPALLYTAMLAFEGIMPFGSEYSIAYVDANGQYVSFFAYYKQMLAGEQSLIFSFAKLIGGDMVGLGAYYLLSPFNLILLLFPAEKMAQAMAVMAVAKTGAAGLTAGLFFRRHAGDDTKAIMLSSAFALMSYNIIYMMNIMWIDGVIILPLVALGIDRICENKSSALYIFSLFYGILVNYYIGFMLCGASVLYFGYRFICDREKLIEKGVHILRYGFASVLAGFMNMFIILPVFASLEGTTKASMPLNELIGLQTQLSFRDLIKHILLPEPTMYDIELMLPNVFVGFVITLLCAAFLLYPGVHWRKKLAGCMIAVVFLLSFYFKTLYYFWHGFAKPICFEYRFAFIFSFFMLLWAGEFLSAVKGKKFMIITLMAVNCASLLWYGHANYEKCNLNGNGFEAFMLEGQPVIEDIKTAEAEDGSFYRVEKDYFYNYNDPMALGYNGMTHFSSGEQLVTRKAVQAAGYAFTEMYGYYGNGSTIASDSMFGIEYLMFRETQKDGLDLVKNYDTMSLYRNRYAWPLAIKADSAVTDMDMGEVTRGLLAQELLGTAWNRELKLSNEIEWMADNSTAGTVTTYTDAEGNFCVAPAEGEKYGYYTVKFTMPEDSNLYINLFTDSRDTVKTITWNGGEIKRYPGYYDHGIRYMGQYSKGDELTVTFQLKGELQIRSLTFLYDDWTYLDSAAAAMETNGYKDTGFDGDSFSVSGTMDSTEGMLLMIPYNKGWTISINGTETPYVPVLDNFVYVEVPEGGFVMDVSYFPPKLLLGTAVSLATLAVCAAYLLIERKLLSAKGRKEHTTV